MGGVLDAKTHRPAAWKEQVETVDHHWGLRMVAVGEWTVDTYENKGSQIPNCFFKKCLTGLERIT